MKEVMQREQCPACSGLVCWFLGCDKAYQRDWWKVSPLLPFKHEPGCSYFDATRHTGRLYSIK